jgi:hypothetical protein
MDELTSWRVTVEYGKLGFHRVSVVDLVVKQTIVIVRIVICLGLSCVTDVLVGLTYGPQLLSTHLLPLKFKYYPQTSQTFFPNLILSQTSRQLPV